MKCLSAALHSPRDAAAAWVEHAREHVRARQRRRRFARDLAGPRDAAVQRLVRVVHDDRREWAQEHRP
ncbi:hypothetical protein [Reyranella sp. CPCC 100927]|uniref:hypothetical protein n=1 Tax=Reyranella sp. CPCC 100927 TaxID=2599616 RepID=UPI0015B488C9|nr:hypothetical protein [Reyranella sp. CPCC 100927]